MIRFDAISHSFDWITPNIPVFTSIALPNRITLDPGADYVRSTYDGACPIRVQYGSRSRSRQDSSHTPAMSFKAQ